MALKRSSASCGGAWMPPADRARASQMATPLPTMPPISASSSAAPPNSTISLLVDSARSRRVSTSVPSRSNTTSRKRASAGLSATSGARGWRRRVVVLDVFDPRDQLPPILGGLAIGRDGQPVAAQHVLGLVLAVHLAHPRPKLDVVIGLHGLQARHPGRHLQRVLQPAALQRQDEQGAVVL